MRAHRQACLSVCVSRARITSLLRPLPLRVRSPFLAARYHSLVISQDACPEELEVTAWTEDGTIMAVRHKSLPHIQVRPQGCRRLPACLPVAVMACMHAAGA